MLAKSIFLDCELSSVGLGLQTVTQGQTATQIQPLMVVLQLYSCVPSNQPTQSQEVKGPVRVIAHSCWLSQGTCMDGVGL